MTATVRGIAQGNREGSANWDGVVEYNVLYYVTTDDINDGAGTARTAFGIPAIGDPYTLGNEVDPRAVVIDKKARERESPWEWEVEVTYSTRQQDEQQEESADPTDLDAEISLSFETRQLAIPGYFDNPESPNVLGNLSLGIVASNGEPYDPAPEYDIANPVLVIKKNLRSVSMAWLMQIANCVNATAFYGADARQLRLMPPQTQRAWDKVIGYYWPTTFTFSYRYETWDFQWLNIGTYYIDTDGTRKQFKDKEGHPFRGLLDVNGCAINNASDDDRGRFTTTGDIQTFKRLRVYREIDFNSLGIL